MIGPGNQRRARIGLASTGRGLGNADESVCQGWTVAASGRHILPGYHGQRLVKILGHSQRIHYSQSVHYTFKLLPKLYC